MTFEEIVDQAIDMVRRRGQVSYRMLKRQFDLDDSSLDDLTYELIDIHQIAVDQDGKMLVWAGDISASPPLASALASAPATAHQPSPIAYTPPYLTEKILTSRMALEGERKQVTVLFADIKDSTEMIKDLDPEAAQQLLDPAIHIMMDAVHRFEGTVNQVLGDGIMALFGAPIAHEDHALRACYAALAMQAVMQPCAEDVRRTHGLEMRIRVGLNSGEVVVRTIGNDLHMDYSAVGPTTHLAARLEQLATPGTARLSAATLRLVEGLVQVKALGPIPIKGMTEPVEVFELTGASTIRRRLQAAVARGLSRFVGRDTEIEVLRRALEQARAGHGQVVAAVGEAGVGKSRLVYEFLHSRYTQGWLVLESVSVSYGKASPYFPVIELLKRYVHAEDTDDARTLRAKVTGQIVTLDEGLQECVPALLSLLEVLPDDSPFLRLEPSQRRQRTLHGLKRILLRESQVQPLLLVFEDLHWIDSETQALLDSLVESLPTSQLLLLVNYRPEYQHAWGSKTIYTQLRLDPLPPESADTLLQALLGDDPSLLPLKHLLIERTQGNPFFLEESIRTLVETEVVAGRPGAYHLTRDLPTIQVPATVQAILAARIDRLPAEEKRLLQTAAVIGTEVPFPLLQAIADLPEEALYRGLTHLQAAEFLYEAQLFPERLYTFRHALTHEVTYGSLLQERRRALHAQIVEALEALTADRLDEQVERLAYHALRGEVWEKALLYFRQAGTRASRHSAHREAVAYYEQALEALRHLPERRDTLEQAVDLRLILRHSLFALGEFGPIIDHLRQAETVARALDDQRRLGLAISYMAHYFWITGDQDRAIESGHRALAIATAPADVMLQIETDFYLGQAHHALGDYRRAMDILRRTITALEGDLSRRRFGVFYTAICRVWLVWCLAETGAFAEGLTRAQEMLRTAEAADNLVSRIGTSFVAGHLYLRQGDLDQAIAVLDHGLALCESGDIPLWLPWITAALGTAYVLLGRLDEALPLLERAVAQSAAMNTMAAHALLVAYLSQGYLHAGRIQDATDQAGRALAYSRVHQERGHEAWVLQLLGDIAARHDPPDVTHAETHYQQALAGAAALGMRPLQAHCHRGLGTLYNQTGQSEQARVELSTAIDMYRDMGMTFWLPETAAALAEVEKS
jgi:class 3 adenylate cyclase/tetratricopeptide (TPR) repeat protein